MKPFLLAIALFVVAGSSALAQTVYPVPPTTNPDFIDYGQAYCNLWVSDIPETINGVTYEVSTSLHFTPGNPAATYGTIDFANYLPNGTVQVTSLPLTNISGALGPATGNSNFTASFSGAFTGSLTFNVNFYSSWRGRSYTYRMPNSFFTIN